MSIQFPPVSRLSLGRHAEIIAPERMKKVQARIAELREHLAGRVVWNVSSSSLGGGVAEMLRSLIAYARGADVDARWVVIQGAPDFFRVTKRLHNALHGATGDGSPLGSAERRIFERVNHDCAAEFAPLVSAGDFVIIHDSQPAGLISALIRRKAHVIWRYHVGTEETNGQTELGWNFLVPYLKDASAYVFSRREFVPAQLDAHRAVVIPPSIDPFSAKNQILPESSVLAILSRTGIIGDSFPDHAPTFLREDGSPGRVDRAASILREGPAPSASTPLVAQISRWDRLKDPVGVLQGFARMNALEETGAALLLVGPQLSSVQDDPEDSKTYNEVVEAWRALPAGVRGRIHLVSLPTEDIEENAAIVNAIQRRCAVIVQKSLQEGFGLTVTEALWKGRPVVASGVGGILDQIEDGVNGVLVRNPRDLQAFADAVEGILLDPEGARQLGENGRQRVVDRYLGVDSLLRFGALIESLGTERDLRAA